MFRTVKVKYYLDLSKKQNRNKLTSINAQTNAATAALIYYTFVWIVRVIDWNIL